MKDSLDLQISEQENILENTQLVLEELTLEEAEKIVGGCMFDYYDWPPIRPNYVAGLLTTK